MNRPEQLALARRRVAELIAWLEAGVKPTEAELAEYRVRLSQYRSRQADLPFDIGRRPA